MSSLPPVRSPAYNVKQVAGLDNMETLCQSEPSNEGNPLSNTTSASTLNDLEECKHIQTEQFAESDIYPNGGLRAYSVVLGSFLCGVTIFGLMDSVGVIESYVQHHQLSDTAVSTVSWIFSAFMFISMFLGAVSGPLYDAFGSRGLLLIGTIFVFVGIFTTGECHEVYQFVLSFGVCLGIGTGFIMSPSVAAVSSWFGKSKRPFFLGIVQSGGSVGGVIFPVMLRSLFPMHGFKWSLRILAFLNLGIDLIGTYLAKDRLDEIHEKTGNKESKSIWARLKESFDPEPFKSIPFALQAVSLFMNEFADTIVLTYISSYAISQGVSERESFNMVTILNGLGILGSFIPSYLANSYGSFNMMCLVSFVITLSIFVVWLPFGQYKAALYVFVCVFGFACASTFALSGAVIGEVTKHTSNFGKGYGTTYSFVSFQSLISLPISGAFIKKSTPHYYKKMVIFDGCMSFVATILFLTTRTSLVGKKVKVKV